MICKFFVNSPWDIDEELLYNSTHVAIVCFGACSPAWTQSSAIRCYEGIGILLPAQRISANATERNIGHSRELARRQKYLVPMSDP